MLEIWFFVDLNECRIIYSLSAEKKREAFFKTWTIKEAYAKATGKGLFVLNGLKREDPATLLRIHGAPEAITRWFSCQVCPSSEYVASLVVAGESWDLRCVMSDPG